jgi:hypothetical protein
MGVQERDRRGISGRRSGELGVGDVAPRSVKTATRIVSTWESTPPNTVSGSVAGVIVTVILSVAFTGRR